MSSTTIVWSINTLERTVSDGIVYAVHYAIKASDDTYSADAYGSVGLDAPEEGSNIIPYADLTEEWAINAVQEKLGGPEKVSEIEAALQNQLDEQRAPTTASGKPF